MKPNQLKALDNYQLFQLLKSKNIEEDFFLIVEQELESRNIEANEFKRLEKKYKDQYECEAELLPLVKLPSPILTPFLFHLHFKNISFLKARNNKKAAKNYERRLQLGISIYGVLIISLMYYFLIYKK